MNYLHMIELLGVVNQKRPVVYQSYLILKSVEADLFSVKFGLGDHSLDTIVKHHKTEEHLRLNFGMGVHKLYDLTNRASIIEHLRLTMYLGEHKLTTIVKSYEKVEDIGRLDFSLGDHRLYDWGVSAMVKDLDNLKLSVDVGDHKLYEDV